MGNVDKNVYSKIPDWKVPLTKKGLSQARKVGKELYEKIHEICNWEKNIIIYSSPWYRARQTAKCIRDKFEKDKNFVWKYGTVQYKEDPRLREQEWANYMEEKNKEKIKRERHKFGTFFYRMPEGESGADVYDRVSSFFDTLFRDFEKEYFPENVIIVSHGLTIKMFLMKWFHWTVEELEKIETPDNCEIVHLRRPMDETKFQLITELKDKEKSEYIDHINDYNKLFK